MESGWEASSLTSIPKAAEDTKELAVLRKTFDTGEDTIFSPSTKPNVVWELLYDFMSSLPDPILGYENYDRLISFFKSNKRSFSQCSF